MPQPYLEAVVLSHRGASDALAAAVAKAEQMSVPQCICIVDASGETIASLRMDGAKYLSMQTARAKARTAASIRGKTGGMTSEFAVAAGIATSGGVTNLPGGLPIKFGGKLAGAIGVGSGTGDQDIEVGKAALAAIGADSID
ncbi:GlcG/HbpS family heme-binding protein [Ensifer adhaerens]|uniref:Heme-binding protein n=1 Tax=Ensifer adhaerens TaxID=106592 RepID=A0A9Q8YGY1_ENSAD|nr:heme-binding protein [Ensifer adhaerens]USJ27987.1 heme-binding protein [Ensifer adhaerens]